MSIEAVFADFAPHLPTEVQFGGPDKWEAFKAPPAITWRPVKAKPDGPGLKLSGGAHKDGDLYVRQVLIGVRIWGPSFTETEQLLFEFINVAFHLLSQHGFAQGEEEWIVGPAQNKGAEVLYYCSVNVPVPRTVKPTRRITDLVLHPTINGNPA